MQPKQKGESIVALLTAEETGKRLRVCKDTMWSMLAAQEIPAFKVRGKWRVDEKDLETFIRKQRAEQTETDKDV
jgi:excisionase family DNA binding protein